MEIAVAFGVLGGLAGSAGAIAVLQRFGDVPPYDSRAWCGWLAVLFGGVAAAGGLLVPYHPRLAVALLVLGSLFGFVSINFFNINSLYIVAILTCWIAALVALVAP